MKLRIVSITQSVYCACGGKATFTGAPAGIRAAIQSWARDHHKPECRAITQKQFHQMRRDQKKKERQAVIARVGKDAQERLL